jgi:hypothetical protein
MHFGGKAGSCAVPVCMAVDLATANLGPSQLACTVHVIYWQAMLLLSFAAELDCMVLLLCCCAAGVALGRGCKAGQGAEGA